MKMKAYPSFDAYVADREPWQKAILKKLRAFVKKTAPSLEESVKYGNGCWLKGKAFVAYVYSAPDHVQFGFVRGSSFKDPKRLLEGKGAWVRHVKLRKPADLDAGAFTPLLRQAARG